MTSMICSAGASMTMLELVLSAMDRDSSSGAGWGGGPAPHGRRDRDAAYPLPRSSLTTAGCQTRTPREEAWSVREYSTPPLDRPYAVHGHESLNLADDVLRRADETPEAVVASRRATEGWA